MSDQPHNTLELDLKTHQIISKDDSCCCSVGCWNTTFNRMFCKLYKDRDEVETMLEGIDLPFIQKQHIKARYVNILENFKKRTRKYSIVFFVGHFVITVGSLFVPALLSIQNSSTSVSIGNGTTIPIYIITFIVSLLVTIFNGILTLFKIDKKFYFLNTTMERLRSEGWQYLGLTGRYSGMANEIVPTHSNQFMYFIHQIEKIKMKQVEEEFYKSDESSVSQNSRSNGGKSTELYPPSLTTPVTEMGSQVPGPIKDVVHSIMHSQSLDNNPLMRSVGAVHGIVNSIQGPVDPKESVAIAFAIDQKNAVIMPESTQQNTENASLHFDH